MNNNSDDIVSRIMVWFLVGGIVLIILGAININRFGGQTNTICIVNSAEVKEISGRYELYYQLEIAVNFTINGELENSYDYRECGTRTNCEQQAKDYPQGMEYDCIWVPNISFITVYTNYVVDGIVMLVCGLVLTVISIGIFIIVCK